MAVAETAKLVVDLSLTGNFNKNIASAQRSFTTLGRNITNTQSRAFKAGQQIGTGIQRGALIAVSAVTALVGVLALSVKEGAEAAKTQEIFAQAIANSGKTASDSQKAIDALIKGQKGEKPGSKAFEATSKSIALFRAQMANLGPVTAAQTALLIDQQKALMNLAGVDDELIKTEQTRLIQMGFNGAAVLKLTPAILDLSKATGIDLLTATKAVGKAANGNATALQRYGIFVDKARFKTDPFGATLDALTKKFGGTTQALSGDLPTRLAAFHEAIKNIQEDAGQKLLPVLTKIVDVAGKDLVPAFGKFIDRILPDVIKGLDEFSNLLANGGAEKGIQAITDALIPLVQLVKVAAAPVKAIVGAFLSLPKEVQTVLVGAFAVNKLTGGLVTNALGGIAGAIAKSVISTPLVNVNGGVVNVNGGVGGGLPGLAGQAAGAAGGLSLGAVVLGVGAAAALGGAAGGAIATAVTSVIAPSDLAQAQQGHSLGNRDPRRFDQNGNVIANSTTELVALAKNADQRDAANSAAIVNAIKADTAANNLVTAAKHDAETSAAIAPAVAKAVADKLATVATGIQTAANQRDAETSSSINEIVKQQATASDIETLRSTTYTGLTGSIAATQTADTNISSAATSAGNTAAAASTAAGYNVAGAIAAKDLSINQAIDIKVNVSAAGVSKSVVVQNRYGPGNGSAGGGRDGEGGGGPGQ